MSNIYQLHKLATEPMSVREIREIIGEGSWASYAKICRRMLDNRVEGVLTHSYTDRDLEDYLVDAAGARVVLASHPGKSGKLQRGLAIVTVLTEQVANEDESLEVALQEADEAAQEYAQARAALKKAKEALDYHVDQINNYIVKEI